MAKCYPALCIAYIKLEKYHHLHMTTKIIYLIAIKKDKSGDPIN